MNFETFLQTVKLREKPFAAEKRRLHGLVGMLSELGELADLVKRAFVYGKEFDAVNLLEEIGDYLWYAVLWCDANNVLMSTLDCSAANNLARLDREGGYTDTLQSVMSLGALWGNFLVGTRVNEAATVHYSIGLCVQLLRAHGFTLSQCLETNDKKLEQRTGKAFNAQAILNRDTAAERAVLEGGAAAK